MSGKYILDSDGNPVPCKHVLKWAKWFEKADRRVALDRVGKVKVSTVFLGLDYSFGGPIPILYETMVFGGVLDGEDERYATRQEAKGGHRRWLQKVKEACWEWL